MGLVGALEELESRNLSSVELMELLGDEAFTAGAALLSQVDSLSKLNGQLRGTNTALDQAGARMDTLNGDIKELGSAIEGLSIAAFGGDVEEVNRSVVQFATGGINLLTENIDTLGNVVTGVAAIFAGRYVASISAATAAKVRDIAATRQKVLADRDAALAARQVAAAELDGLRVNQAALSSSLQLATTERTRSAIRRQLAANTVALTAANSAYAASQVRVGATARAAALGVASLRRAMALLGGPLGIISLVATELYLYSLRADDARQATKRFFSEVEKQKAISDLNEKIKEVKEEITSLEERATSGTGRMANSFRIRLGQAKDELDSLERKLFETMNAAAGGEDLWDAWRPRLFEEFGETITSSSDDISKKVSRARESILGFLSSITMQVDTFGKADSEVLKYRLTVGDLSDDIRLLGDEGDRLVESIVAQQQALDQLSFEDTFDGSITALQRQRDELQLTDAELFAFQQTTRLLEEAESRGITVKRDMIAELHNEAVATFEATEARASAKRILEDIRTPQQEYIDKLKEITRLQKLDELTAEQANAAREAAKESYDDIIKKTQELDTFTRRAAENMQDAMGDFFFDFMQGELGNLEDSFKRTIDRMVAEALAAELGKKLFGGLVDADTSGSGLLGGLIDATGLFGGPVFGEGFDPASGTMSASGDYDGGFGPTDPSFLSSAANLIGGFFGGARAQGGPVNPNQSFLVGENGPEMFRPNQSGNIIPAPQTQQMSGNVTVQINVQGIRDEGGLRKTSAQIAQAAGRASQRAIARNT